MGEAFGGPDPHPADDPSNNPFAEGGVDAPRQPERRARSEPGDNAGGAAAQGGNPLSYLFSLMNAFGINGQALGNGIGLAANPSDYIWGGEANFQNLLNDLMEQVCLFFRSVRCSSLADSDDLVSTHRLQEELDLFLPLKR